MKKIVIVLLALLLLSSSYAFDPEQEFKDRNGQGWDVEVAEWGYVIFAGREEPGLMNPPVDAEQAATMAKNFIEKNADLMGIETIEITNIELKGGDDAEYSLWVIDYEGQYYEGIPILDTYTKVLMQIDGQIYGVGNLRYSVDEKEIKTTPSISSGGAGGAAQGSLGSGVGPTSIEEVLYVENDTIRAAWAVNFGDPENKTVIVDGETGEVVRINDWEPEIDEVKPEPQNYIIIFILILVILILLFFLIKGRK